MTEKIAIKVIKELEDINPNDEFAYEEAIKILLSIGQIPVLIDKIDANTTICRTRTHTKEEPLFEKVTDIFIAPQNAITSFARCNKPHQSKLYCSENRPVNRQHNLD